MGAHPETEGYYTTTHGGFEFAKNPPELPEWLYNEIQKAFPINKYRKPVTSGICTQSVNLTYEEGSTYHQEESIAEARIYLDHLSIERAADYEEWLAVGMCLHQVDDRLIEDWIAWSEKAPNFENGVCEQKWRSFERVPGGPTPEGSRGLHSLRAKAKEDGYIELGNYVVESPETLVKKAQEFFSDKSERMGEHDVAEQILESIIGFPDRGMRDEIEERKKRERRPKNPPSSELAEYATEMVIQCGWRFDPRYEVFMFYQQNKGVWRREEYKHEYKHFIQDLFVRERIPLPGGFNNTLLNDVVSLTQAYISHTYWDDDDDRLAFTNGVLEVSSGEFLEHSPEHYITWGLDFDYDPYASPGPIIDWLLRTQYGDNDRVQVLRAWLKSCRSRSRDSKIPRTHWSRRKRQINLRKSLLCLSWCS